MQRFASSPLAIGLVAALATALACDLAAAATAVGVTASNELVTFDTATPGTLLAKVTITGLQTGETIVGLDVRRSNGRIYALGSTSRLYTIDRVTGAATEVGTGPFTPALSGTDFGFDFDPVRDQIRVVSDADQNLRIDPDTGLVIDTDTNTTDTQIDANLNYGLLDSNALANPNVVAAAYDRNAVGAAATTLWVIDSSINILARQGDVDGSPESPDAGILHTIGALNFNPAGPVGFDIAGNTAYAVFAEAAATSSSLYTVDLTTGAATLVGVVGGGSPLQAFAIVPERLIGLTASDQLVFFGASSPGTVSSPLAITGLQTGEHVLAIDVRPSTRRLYALGSTGRLYRVDAITGAATEVGLAPFSVALSGTDFGMDFNPTADRIRVVSNTGQNLRINPDTGDVVDADTVTAGVQPDTNLAFAAGDPNAAATPSVIGLAYDTNRPGAATTTLFGIDSGLDVLVRQGSVNGTPDSPNGGQLTTVGPLGVDVGGDTGFDIVGTNNTGTGTAYAAMTAPAGTSTDLYSIDLTTGTATSLGTIGGGQVIRGLTSEPVVAPAAIPPAIDLFGLTDANSLVAFRSDTPGIVSAPIPITGLQTGENVVAIDVRPQNGVLYALSDQNRVYGINHTTGAAQLVGAGPFTPSLVGTQFGLDVNPVADLLRVVSDADQNLRINPSNGNVIDTDAGTPGTQIDATLAYATGDPNQGANPEVTAAAYDRSSTTSTATTLFDIDTGLDVLVRQGSVDGAPDSPNTGLLTTIGPLGVDSTGTAGFEIAPDGTALAALFVGQSSKLHTIDLATGAANLVGEIGGGMTIRGLSIAPTEDLPPPAQPLDVTKLKITIQFCGSGKDHIELAGTLPAPTASVAGTTVDVNIGGFAESFTLDSKGKGVTGDDKFKLVGKPKNGLQKFTVAIKKEDVEDELAPEGLTAETDFTKAPRQVVVRITFLGVVYEKKADVLWTAKAEHSGFAKLQL